MNPTERVLNWWRRWAPGATAAPAAVDSPYAPCDSDPPEVAQARALLRAVELGGVPLNPAKVNAVARALGLDVSSRAPMEQTLERLRAAVARQTVSG